MLDEKTLKQVLQLKGLSKTDQLLLCLAVAKDRPKTIQEIRDLAIANGVGTAKGWNIAALLGGSRKKAIRTTNGWELGTSGLERVREIAGSHIVPPSAVAVGLRNLLPKLTNGDIHAFVEEAIACYETRLYRAAVVLSWVGALSLIYDRVIARHLAAFNTEALRRDAKWRPAKTSDDLARMKEHDFLQVVEAISVIGKSVKNELEGCLKFRNGCGHPNSLKIGPSRVEAHIEVLLQNVFAVFV